MFVSTVECLFCNIVFLSLSKHLQVLYTKFIININQSNKSFMDDSCWPIGCYPFKVYDVYPAAGGVGSGVIWVGSVPTSAQLKKPDVARIH